MSKMKCVENEMCGKFTCSFKSKILLFMQKEFLSNNNSFSHSIQVCLIVYFFTPFFLWHRIVFLFYLLQWIWTVCPCFPRLDNCPILEKESSLLEKKFVFYFFISEQPLSFGTEHIFHYHPLWRISVKHSSSFISLIKKRTLQVLKEVHWPRWNLNPGHLALEISGLLLSCHCFLDSKGSFRQSIDLASSVGYWSDQGVIF